MMPAGNAGLSFDFVTAARIVFGPGTRAQLPELTRGLGSRALVVTGRSAAAGEVAGQLERTGLSCARVVVTGEPTVAEVQAACALAVSERCRVVVAVGGGSVIDTGKAVAALVANGGDPFDYLEVVGAGRPLSAPSLPLVAVPTTAGSGAEVTRNAVLTVPERRVKVSLRSPSMLPSVALVDPELTYDLPPALTATTGLDALAQLLEPYLSRRANPVTDAFCREGIVRISWALLAACGDGHDAAARESMSLASLFGGLALANAGLGAVHGLAGPIGGRCGAPHGAVCAALLPHVLRANLSALRARDGASPVLVRFDHVARLLTGDRRATAAVGIEWVADLAVACGVGGLAEYGVSEGDIGPVVEQAARSSSMKGNAIELTPEELAAIVRRAL